MVEPDVADLLPRLTWHMDEPTADPALIAAFVVCREASAGATVMLKVTIPTQPGLYGDLAADPRVLRVLALSGGYSRDQACALLAHDPTLIASFSRALLEGLTDSQSDEQFNAQLESSIEQIYQASVTKQPASS